MIIWFYTVISVLVCALQTSRALNRTIEMQPNDTRSRIPVWTRDDVVLFVNHAAITSWSFRNIEIASLLPGVGPVYNYSNISLGITIDAGSTRSGSFLFLRSVNQTYTGVYTGSFDSSKYSIDLVVHDVSIISSNFILTNNSDGCKAFLNLFDNVYPSTFNFTRTLRSLDMNFTNSSIGNTNNTYQILDGNINVTNSSVNTTIDVQYTLINNSYSTSVPLNISLDSSFIQPPEVNSTRVDDNCTIFVKHMVTLPCVKNVDYYLHVDGSENKLGNSNNLNNFTNTFATNNSSRANLFIVYDVIYAKYSFETNVTQCIVTVNEATTTINTPPIVPSQSLAEWKIAVIVLGTIIGVTLLVGLIAFCCYRKRSEKKDKSRNSYTDEDSFNQFGVQKLVSSATTTPQIYSPRMLSMPPEQTVQEHQQYAPTSNNNRVIRPTIPKPPNQRNVRDVYYINDHRDAHPSYLQPVSSPTKVKYQLERADEQRQPRRYTAND